MLLIQLSVFVVVVEPLNWNKSKKVFYDWEQLSTFWINY